MKKLLYVKSSLFGDNGQSSQLAQHLIEQWQQVHQGEVTERDLIAQPLPMLDLEVMGALGSEAGQRSEAQQQVIDLADQLKDEIETADALVIGVPTYNFNLPIQMKAWFDLLARAGVTFKYTDKGPVGLMQDKPVYLIATRGGQLHQQGIDHQMPFVRQFLAFIGLTSVHTIYAEDLAMGDAAEASLDQAKKEISQIIG
ncbi:FMN-dependent NADH-azoreductase [Pelagibaculum spongiae]|uniref:FMN dependent NADH:quinone oxidoreductase n=1 Tax=Pelagibaculum spongiae TaxID=2080658 RepID=A0A2V1GR18_9GAMM|nr:NAD(P)H-dependent oxidoreductase [Pelagibaculum spongiae]PVZ63420.1 FMN-dependent NADH-azoreductase [Pelagibaculum spongiae]